jgi:hypothetical protein
MIASMNGIARRKSAGVHSGLSASARVPRRMTASSRRVGSFIRFMPLLLDFRFMSLDLPTVRLSKG